MNRLLTLPEASGIMEISQSSLRELYNRGKIEGYKIRVSAKTVRIMFDENDILDYMLKKEARKI